MVGKGLMVVSNGHVLAHFTGSEINKNWDFNACISLFLETSLGKCIVILSSQ